MRNAPPLFLQHNSDAPQNIQIGGVVIAVYSHRSPTKATPNEDSAAVIHVGDESVVLAVADGVGGIRGGEHASNLTLRRLSETVAERSRRHHPSRTTRSIRQESG